MDLPKAIDPTAFSYVRTVIGIIVGLSIGRILTGLARFVQHPRQQRIFPAHLLWAFFLLIYVLHFWWWEFRLGSVPWTFYLYVFVALYASIFFFLCTLLFPDTMTEYSGFADYFMSRRKWFYGILIVAFLFDIVDSLIKGPTYLLSFGLGYWLRIVVYVVGGMLAIAIPKERFQTAFAAVALISEIAWAIVFYDTIA